MNKIKSNILHYPLVSIIVLNYNGLDQLKKSFKSLLRLDYPNYEIILVDNCSSDNSLNYIEKLSNGNVRIEILDQNYGYSKGKNIGASLAKGEFIWLLDNDIIPNKDCLKKLVSFMKKVPEAAVSFPVLIDFFSKKISHYGGESTYYGINQFLEKLPIDKFDGKRPFKTSYPIGAVAFYRKEVWDYLNGYDDLNKFYLDDTDLGPRIWISGYKIYCIPNAKSFHYEISRKKDVEYLSWIFENFVSGIAIGIIKNYSLFNLLLSLPLFLLFSFIKGIKNSIKYKKFNFIAGYYKGIFKLIKNNRIILEKRQMVQQKRKNDDIFLKIKLPRFN